MKIKVNKDEQYVVLLGPTAGVVDWCDRAVTNIIPNECAPSQC